MQGRYPWLINQSCCFVYLGFFDCFFSQSFFCVYAKCLHHKHLLGKRSMLHFTDSSLSHLLNLLEQIPKTHLVLVSTRRLDNYSGVFCGSPGEIRTLVKDSRGPYA